MEGFSVPSHAFRSSVNLKVSKVKINAKCLRVFLIGTNQYYRCKQTMCQVYPPQGRGTKIVNLPDQKNIVYILTDHGFCLVSVTCTRS